jgi:hypothetical protein
MSAALIAAVCKGYDVTSKAAYRPIKKAGKVVGELQIRRDETLTLWLKAVPADPAQKRAVDVLTTNAKWKARLEITDATLQVGRQILEAAAAASAPVKAAPVKKVAATRPAAKKQPGAVKA